MSEEKIEAPQGQPQEVRAPIAPEAQQAQTGQPEVPEKFRGVPIEEVYRSYEESEKRMKGATQEAADAKKRAQELEHQVGVYQEVFRNPQVFQAQKGPSEEEIFRQEWEKDPAMAVYNQNQRTQWKAQQTMSQTATNLFYQTARSDEKNFPGFAELEPKMLELAKSFGHLIDRTKINSPEVITLLYRQARAENMALERENARIQGHREAETRRKEVNRAGFEGPTPNSASAGDSQDKSMDQLEKELGFVQR